MRIALDTNVLAYAEGVGDEPRRSATHALLSLLPAATVVVPVQALGELFRVLTGKRGMSAKKARTAVLGWVDTFDTAESTQAAMMSALDMVVEHRLQVWDALILSAAAEAQCRVLLSEDFQHGFTVRGVTVVNPYAPTPHPLLKSLLDIE